MSQIVVEPASPQRTQKRNQQIQYIQQLNAILPILHMAPSLLQPKSQQQQQLPLRQPVKFLTNQLNKQATSFSEILDTFKYVSLLNQQKENLKPLCAQLKSQMMKKMKIKKIKRKKEA